MSSWFLPESFLPSRNPDPPAPPQAGANVLASTRHGSAHRPSSLAHELRRRLAGSESAYLEIQLTARTWVADCRGIFSFP